MPTPPDLFVFFRQMPRPPPPLMTILNKFRSEIPPPPVLQNSTRGNIPPALILFCRTVAPLGPADPPVMFCRVLFCRTVIPFFSPKNYCSAEQYFGRDAPGGSQIASPALAPRSGMISRFGYPNAL